MANSVDPDQIEAVSSGQSVIVSNARQIFAADDFSRRYFRCIFSWRFKGKVDVRPSKFATM